MSFKLNQVLGPLLHCQNCPYGSEIKGGQLVCGKNSAPVLFMTETYACPAGFWKTEVSAPTVFMRVSTASLWDQVKDLWAKAESFVSTATSGFAEPEIVEQRKASCAACPNLQKTPSGDFCGACGCGQNPLARLDRKLLFRDLKCPINAKGFAQ